MKPQPNKKLHYIAIEDKLRYTLEDILNDITEYNVKGDIDYFLDCWKTSSSSLSLIMEATMPMATHARLLLLAVIVTNT